jgi:uncharacterized protein
MSASSSIDSLRFARSGECLTGELPVASLPRLAGSLAGETGTVRYRLCGTIAEGRPALELLVEADVQMLCQRCLKAYVQHVASSSMLPIAGNEAQLASWERDDPLLDALLADPHLDVQALVEDEMLLSLPVVPRHPEGECRVQAD